MNSFSTSGVMSKMMNSGNSQQPTEAVSIPSSAESSIKSISWTQTADDIEIRYILPISVTVKQLTVKFRASKLLIVIPTLSTSSSAGVDSINLRCPDDDEEVVQMAEALGTGPDGADLYATVTVDECTWSVERGGGIVSADGSRSNVLTITLMKAVSKSWPSLLKK